ncbi:MAG: hypothetical protein QF619_08350 [Candidatus Binatia bacterium]|jgi:hypothetical protein|nr:hypothetical protein [Candidatus Binatia bacterium]
MIEKGGRWRERISPINKEWLGSPVIRGENDDKVCADMGSPRDPVDGE